ncbi:alginate export family protein [Glaciecola sp. SC05]|uniref:alginate export family protein n=1 Tax=Glaciecola sp. SC05 TaxID=1987355 RepID=UPI00352801FC
MTFYKQRKPHHFLAVSCLAFAIASTCTTSFTAQAQNNAVYDALSSGSVFADFRLRYEGVSQDNILEDANALTFRTRLGYTSGDLDGWSFTVEMEDNRIALGVGDYTVGPSGFNPGIYSVIADPEFTELDQGFVQYKKDGFTAKIGRQVIAFDTHRFVGHVGWRQDRQTFDAASFIYAPNKDVKVQYSYLDQRNRIFGEDADIDAKDHLLNASYQTELGKLVGYAYLLETDIETSNALDTYGLSFNGSQDFDGIKLIYGIEYAKQSSKTDLVDFDADYLFTEFGATFSGVTAKVGYEVLGSDDGNYGFSTPLATLHKFNGWSDQFLSTPILGLIDTSVTLTGSAFGGKWLAVYHDFQADDGNDVLDDYGTEINLQYVTKFAENYEVAVKYADYSSDGFNTDTEKLWVWVSTKF